MTRNNELYKEYRCLVFDWDGTLIDSIERITTSLQVAADKVCGIQVSKTDARDVIGMGLTEAVTKLLPGAEASLIEQTAEAYKQDYLYDSTVPCELFAGVRECLQQLRADGYLMAIATGKSRPGLDRSLAEHDMAQYFHTTRCAGEYPSKPQPDMLLSIVEDLDTHTGSTLMIGDSEHDMRMAKNAAVDAIGVTHGAHCADTLKRHDPVMCLQHITEISGFLSHNCATR